MSAEENRIYIVGSESETEEPSTETNTGKGQKSGGDMGKIAMIVSLLSVVLLVIFFFGLNRNLAGVTEEVKALRGLRSDVQGLDHRVGELEVLPGTMKYNMVTEMEMQSILLARQIKNPDQMEKLQQVRELLLQLKSDFAK